MPSTAEALFSHKRYFRICRPARVIISQRKEDGRLLRNTEHQPSREIPELPSEFHLVQWLPADSLTYQCEAAAMSMKQIAAALPDHDVVGIDAASVACAHALDPKSDDLVLDLCCAPGGKAMILSEFVDRVYGVDVSRERLFLTRSLCKQHGYQNITLIRADGRVFDPLDDTTYSLNWRGSRKGKTDEFHSRQEMARRKFTKVLVDAQCTHDGSMKHISKFKDQASYERKQAETLTGLADLQYDLLLNGWKLLDREKASSRLIYSTCSFSEEQNERIAERFLRSRADAEIEAIDWPVGTPAVEKPINLGGQAGCGYLFGLSFEGDSVNDQTGGLFLIKFKVRNLSLEKTDLKL